MDTEQLTGLLRDSEERYSTVRCEFAVRFHPEIAAKAERQQIEAGIASVFQNQDWMVIEAVSAEFDTTLPENTFAIPATQPAEDEVTKQRGWLSNRK